MTHIKVIMVMRLQEGKGSFQVILDKEIRQTTSKTFGSTQKFHSDTPKICVCLILFFKLSLKSLNTTCFFFLNYLNIMAVFCAIFLQYVGPVKASEGQPRK